MIWLIVISLLVLLLYVNHFSLYLSAWRKYPEFKSSGTIPPVKISVVVACRNEEEMLPALLDGIDKQTFPHDQFELILADDHSEDLSIQIAKEFAATRPWVRCIALSAEGSGKKAAIAEGIRNASHELIVLTDADCIPASPWLETIAGVYASTGAAMIVGLIDVIPQPGKLSQFVDLELISLVASGASAVAWGRPIYCNSANLAFQKGLFLEQADPMSQAAASGDDTFFMHRLKGDRSNRIVLMKSKNGLVLTRNSSDFGEFMSQRIRWASKSPHYSDSDILVTGILVFSMAVAMVFSALLFITGKNLVFFVLMLGVKSATDLIFLQEFLSFYGRKLKTGMLVLFEIVYPFYIIVAALAGLAGHFKWKGRKYSFRGVSSPVQK